MRLPTHTISGASTGRPSAASRLAPVAGPESPAVHRVRDHAELLGLHAAVHQQVAQRVAHADHARGLVERLHELRAGPRILRRTSVSRPRTVTNTGSDRRRATRTQPTPSGIAEVRVHHVERAGAAEARQDALHGPFEPCRIERLQDTRQVEHRRVLDATAGVLVTGLARPAGQRPQHGEVRHRLQDRDRRERRHGRQAREARSLPRPGCPGPAGSGRR